MDIRKMKNKTIIMILITASLILQLTGCTKMFWEYEYVWVSESPYVRFEEEKGKAYIVIDDKEYELEAVWEHGGTIMTFYFITSRTYMAEEDIAWDIYYEYKKGKLYLTIKEDNIGNYEGQTIVLEPQECGT